MTQEPTYMQKVIEVFSKANNDHSYSDQWWPSHAQAAVDVECRLEAHPPARILDLACGMGASTAALALRGYDVTGIDCTPLRIDIARRKAQEKGATVQWLCQDMRQIAYTGEFDYVLLRDVIFGIFETEQEDRDLIRRMALALKPGGRCLLEVYNKEFSLSHGVEDHIFYDERLDRFIPRGSPYGLATGIKLYSHDQWRDMLAAHGLSIVKWDGWKHQRDPDPPPWRADIIVAEKAAVAVASNAIAIEAALSPPASRRC